MYRPWGCAFGNFRTRSASLPPRTVRWKKSDLSYLLYLGKKGLTPMLDLYQTIIDHSEPFWTSINKYLSLTMNQLHPSPWWSLFNRSYTSGAAQGGGGSFKNRKPIGEIGCCESGMAERIHWWTERCLRSPLFLSLSLTIYPPTNLYSMYLSIYRSIDLSIYLSIHLSFFLIYLSIFLSF